MLTCAALTEESHGPGVVIFTTAMWEVPAPVFFASTPMAKKNVHLRAKDQLVFLPSATVDLAECAGLLAGVRVFAECLQLDDLVPAPSNPGSQGSSSLA